MSVELVKPKIFSGVSIDTNCSVSNIAAQMAALANSARGADPSLVDMGALMRAFMVGSTAIHDKLYAIKGGL